MTDPLSAAEFSALMVPMGPFEARPHVAVAVSGGADSLCLALLAAQWARDLGGTATALTVDHGLRSDSAAEAEKVGQWLAARGITHHVLRWQGDKPNSDIQAAARGARYALLEQWCAAHAVLHLMLAHHRDDQAETLLLRLARGSGVDGLSAMAVVSERFSVRLLRPLLGEPRDRLAATLRSQGQEWVEDPSNRDPKFARVRVRTRLPDLAVEGVTPSRLADTARRLGRARAALEADVAAAAARWVGFHPAGFAHVADQTFAHLSDEIGLRLLARLLQAVGGGAHPPREERVESVHAMLRGGRPRAATLGGCRVVPGKERFLVCREAGRMAPEIPVLPGEEAAWDGRFRVALHADAPFGLRLGGLRAEGWSQLREQGGRGGLFSLPAPVRTTLPAIYDQQGLCEVPYLGYNREAHKESVVRWIVAAPTVPATVAGRRLV